MTDVQPLKHYGYSPDRPAYTACGEEKAFVVVTFFPEKVTCPVCVDEVRGMEFVSVTELTGEANR